MMTSRFKSKIDYTPPGFIPSQIITIIPHDKRQKGSILWNATKYETIASLAYVLEFEMKENIDERAGTNLTTALQEAIFLGDPDRVVLLCRAGASLRTTILHGDFTGMDILDLSFSIFKCRNRIVLKGVQFNAHREKYIHEYLHRVSIHRDTDAGWTMYYQEMLDTVFFNHGW